VGESAPINCYRDMKKGNLRVELLWEMPLVKCFPQCWGEGSFREGKNSPPLGGCLPRHLTSPVEPSTVYPSARVGGYAHGGDFPRKPRFGPWYGPPPRPGQSRTVPLHCNQKGTAYKTLPDSLFYGIGKGLPITMYKGKSNRSCPNQSLHDNWGPPFPSGPPRPLSFTHGALFPLPGPVGAGRYKPSGGIPTNKIAQSCCSSHPESPPLSQKQYPA